jgi:hypothetical protein
MGWVEHAVRLHLIAGMMATVPGTSMMDPAAGDGSLEHMATLLRPWGHILVGDISKPNVEQMRARYGHRAEWHFGEGDISAIIEDGPRVDLIVLSEILEHLEDPDAVLRLARGRADTLIASSPVMRPGQVDPNPEHLWQFDEAGYIGMIEGAGWERKHSALLRFPTMYDFQIWVCR